MLCLIHNYLQRTATMTDADVEIDYTLPQNFKVEEYIDHKKIQMVNGCCIVSGKAIQILGIIHGNH